MPMNRLQFQPGLSMRELLTLYGTDQLCEAALIARRGVGALSAHAWVSATPA